MDYASQGDAVVSSITALAYWRQYGHRWPRLAKLAQIILCVLRSSAASERNWSSGDIVSGGRRSNASPATVETSIMLAKNTPLQAKLMETSLFDAMMTPEEYETRKKAAVGEKSQ